MAQLFHKILSHFERNGASDMPKEEYTIEINAPASTVFDLIHDYNKRLDWDTMLSQAKLLNGATAADVGVRSLCVGTWRSAFLGMETEYVQFKRGEVAAIKLTKRLPFFDRFAATIRHEPLGQNRSRATYIYHFTARPRFATALLEPIMNRMLKYEVQHRLQALQHYFGAEGHA